MSGRMLVTFAALVFWLIPSLAPAATTPLFALQLGAYTLFDCSDGAGHQWQAKIKVVAENISLNSQTYYHIRFQNWDPYLTNPSSSEDILIRSTDTQSWVSLGGSEWLMFQTGPPVETTWTYTAPWGDVYCDIVSFGPVTVPMGTFDAYAERTRGVSVDLPGYYRPDWFYLFPGPGLIKEVAENVELTRVPRTSVLSGAGYQGVSLFPLKTGLRLTYNARDSLGNTWKMTKHVMEQVTIGGETFFRVRTSNFDPFSPWEEGDMYSYLRSTQNQVFESWDGISDHVSYQVNSPGTTWSYPGEGGVGTCENTITGVTPIQVLGGSYLAYVNQAVGVTGGWYGPDWFYYAVPGLGMVYEDNFRIGGETEARLYYTLASVTQGNAGPAVNLLLLD
jgi:hypothetical protein